MKKYKNGFSLRNAIIAMSILGVTAVAIPSAMQVSNDVDNKTCLFDSSSKNLFVKLYQRYGMANTAYGYAAIDPFVLDLDEDGVVVISAPSDGIYFDYNGDGFAEKIAWVTGGDGVLAIDLNQNGKIDNGDEIIKIGELDAYDTNGDGVISRLDEKFNLFRIIKSDGSVRTLAQESIAKINTAEKLTDIVDKNNNSKVAEGSFMKLNGKSYRFDVYNLSADFYDSKELNLVKVSPSVKKLPNIKCRGTVNSLHQAMMKNAELKSLIEKFVKESNDEKRCELVPQILKLWANPNNTKVANNSLVITQGQTNDEHLFIVEQLMGYRYKASKDLVTPEMKVFAESQIETVYLGLENYVYAELMSQSHLADLTKLIKTNKDGKNDLTAVTSKLSKEVSKNPEKGKQRVYEFAKMIKGLDFDKNSNYLDPKDNNCFYLKFTENDRDLKWKIDSVAKIPLVLDKSKLENGEFRGTQGADAVQFKDADYALSNTVHVGYGADVLFGGSKSDVLIGCQDDDILDGGDGDDTLIGNTQNDLIFGGKGDDKIFAGEDDDIIFGGDGNDVIHPDGVKEDGSINPEDKGNDVIIGGRGNDTIYSYVGNDTFIFNLGDGNDTIYEEEGNDTLYFGKGITWNNLVFEKVGLDMSIKIKGTTDSIVVKNWFAEGQSGVKNKIIENFEFANGQKYTYQNITLKKF